VRVLRNAERLFGSSAILGSFVASVGRRRGGEKTRGFAARRKAGAGLADVKWLSGLSYVQVQEPSSNSRFFYLDFLGQAAIGFSHIRRLYFLLCQDCVGEVAIRRWATSDTGSGGSEWLKPPSYRYHMAIHKPGSDKTLPGCTHDHRCNQR
jgi:hypothetical protein